MTDRLFKAILGDVIPMYQDDALPTPYRRTRQVPPAPKMTGSPSEPREGASPIMENPDNPQHPLI